MYCECSRRIPENDQPSIKTGLFRADAARNMDTLLRVAMVVFETSGVDPPVREIADRAGVGVGTVYRHVHSNSQLIVAVLETQIDACAEAVADLGRKYEPGEALERWMQRHGDFSSDRREFAGALHRGDAWTAACSLPNDRLDIKIGHAESIISE
jgi:AcrR family transcriptional regulator